MQGSMSSNVSIWSLVGSVEDCCLQHPFQPRSFQITAQGSPCHECIGNSVTLVVSVCVAVVK